MPKIGSHGDACAIVVTVSGDMDLGTVDEFSQRGLDGIAQGDGRSLMIDVSAVTFIDFTGLRGLVTVNNAASAAGMDLMLRGDPTAHAPLLRITATDAVAT